MAKKPVIDMEADAQAESLDRIALGKAVNEYQALLDQLAASTAETERLAKECREMEEKVIPAIMGTIPLIKLEDGTKIEVKPMLFPSIAEENKARAFAWLRKNGFGSLIKNEVKATFGKNEDVLARTLIEFATKKGIPITAKESVHPGTLTSFVKEQFAAGKDVTPAISITRVTKAAVKFPKSKE